MQRQISLGQLSRVAREKVIAALCAADPSDMTLESAEDCVTVSIAVPVTHPLLTEITLPLPLTSAAVREAPTVVLDSPRLLGRRGSASRRASSSPHRSPSPASRGPRTVQWAARMIDDILSLAVKFRIHPTRNNIVSVPDIVRALLINRCGVASLHRTAFADIVAASLKFRSICPTCNAFYVFVCSDEPSMLAKFILMASMRLRMLPYIIRESQRTEVERGDIQIVLRKYIPLESLSGVVKTILRGNPRAPFVKTRLALWLKQERLRSSSISFDLDGHVDAMELLLALVECATADPTFRSSPSVDALLSNQAVAEGESPRSIVPEPVASASVVGSRLSLGHHSDPEAGRSRSDHMTSERCAAVSAELQRRGATRTLMSPPRPSLSSPLASRTEPSPLTSSRAADASGQSRIVADADATVDEHEAWMLQRLTEGLQLHRQGGTAERTALERIAVS